MCYSWAFHTPPSFPCLWSLPLLSYWKLFDVWATLWSGAHIIAIEQCWLAWWLHQKNAYCPCMRTGVLIPGTMSKAGPHRACIYSPHPVGRDRRALLGSEYPWISQVKIQWKTLYKRRKRRAVEENTQLWLRPPHACTCMCMHKQRKTKPWSLCSPQP